MPLPRRRFLHLSTLAAAGALSPYTLARPTGTLQYGVQYWTVHQQADAGLPALLQNLRRIGFTQFELHPRAFSVPAPTLRSVLADSGLAAPSCLIPTGLEAQLGYASQLGLEYIGVMLPTPRPVTLDDYRAFASTLNRWGTLTRSHGIRLVFLSHNHEFLPQQDAAGPSTGFDQLLLHTDPALVHLEVDVYWIVQAGLDPARFLHRHRDRIDLLHLKDRIAGSPTSFLNDASADHVIELGRGSIPWPALLHQAARQHIRYAFLDYDRTTLPVLESLKISLDYLRTLHP